MRVLATIEFLLIAALTVGAQTKPAPKRPAAPSKSASPSASAPSKSVPLKVAGQQCPIPRNELQQVYRLYMKDGSLQPVTECELLDAGQRVHYKSAERGEWEDVPSSLVDWPATQKVAKEGPGEKPAEASADAAAADAEEEAVGKAEESKSPQIQI